MSSQLQRVPSQPPLRWQMPIIPQSYDRSPLTTQEWWALEHCGCICAGGRGQANSNSKESLIARGILARLDQPITDVFRLRHQGCCSTVLSSTLVVMRREMYRYGKAFWNWEAWEWMETLCPTASLFSEQRFGASNGCRMVIMNAAYLLGGVTDLRPVGLRQHVADVADTCFGAQLVTQQFQRVFDPLARKGYGGLPGNMKLLRQCLSMLFILNRSPYLEDISEELLREIAAESPKLRREVHKITVSLQNEGLLSSLSDASSPVAVTLDSSNMAPSWYAWCLAWYAHAVDLSPRVRRQYANLVLVVGRWLKQHVPEVCTPEQWTEDLALRFRADVCSWTSGQYAGQVGRELLENRNEIGSPISAEQIAHYLIALRRYFTDLIKRPHAVAGKPARKITLDFVPKEVLTVPAPVRRALDKINPRDIHLQVWAKLVIAAATLSSSDLPQGKKYPLSFYRQVSASTPGWAAATL